MANLRVVSAELTKESSTLEIIIKHGVVTLLHSQDFNDLLSCLSFIQKYRGIFYCVFGKHPSNLGVDIENNFRNGTLSLVYSTSHDIIKKNCESIIAIGECGLDYHSDNKYSKELQKQIFKMYIELAIEFAKPIFIFDNYAFNDVIEIIDEYDSEKRANMGLWRCHKVINAPYATTEQLKEYTRRGFKILVTCGIYYNSVSNGFIEAMKEIPLDKIVVGSSNSINQRIIFNNNPSDIPIILKKFYEIRQQGVHKETGEQILFQIMENSIIVLGIPFTNEYKMAIKRNYVYYISSIGKNKIYSPPKGKNKPYSPSKGKKKTFEKKSV